MSDRERFEAFKENAIRENEVQYGAEIREKYGEASVEASNRKLKGMSEEAWQQFEGLEKDILAYATGIYSASEMAKRFGAPIGAVEECFYALNERCLAYMAQF